MDKIRPAIQWLVHNRFWVTCVVVTISSIATWFLAWNAIETKREDRARLLNGKHSSIKGVIGTRVKTGEGDEELPIHPNQSTKKGMEERIKAAAKGALEAWQVRYNKQQELLKYSEVLSENIRKQLQQHQPMEKPLDPGKELLGRTQLGSFGERITRQMPLIADKIGAKWTYDEDGAELKDESAEAGSSLSDSSSSDTMKFLVRWDSSNQELWNSKMTQFQGFNGNKEIRPTVQQALALQQDLWILEGIFGAVAEVNKGFIANDLAPVEKIDHVLVGIDAINSDIGKVAEFDYQPPEIADKSASKKKKKRGIETAKDRRKKSQKSKSRRKAKSKRKGAVFNPEASKSPFHGRYVDRDYTQLNESDIVAAITSDKLTNQSYLAVAKRVPVRIALKMDERRINDFLAAAANSPFAFEIRQVRINKHVPGEGVNRKASGASSGGEKANRNDSLSNGGGAGAGTSDQGQNSSKGGGDNDAPFKSESRGNFDIKIEFIGIVKIYNPVNESLILPKSDQSQ